MGPQAKRFDPRVLQGSGVTREKCTPHVIRRACDEASQRTGNQGEEEQHPRMLRIGELEGESEFLTPTREFKGVREFLEMV
jgi:hypothetical protein